MAAFLARRLLHGVAIVFIVATVTFVLIHAAPGEPLDALVGDARLTPVARDLLRRSYGLDRPVTEQYVRYLAKVARGDLDISLVQQRPVRDVMARALPPTLLLMSAALAAGFLLGVPLGAWQAARLGSRLDRLVTRITVSLSAVPDFWLALALALVFAERLGWFPLTGMVDATSHNLLSLGGRAADVLRHLALPATSLALLVTSVVARHQRSAVLDVLPDEFVRTARAKGASEHRVILRHALRNALLPTITLLGLALPSLVGGAVFVESIFAWPGMGRLAVDALASRDYPVLLGAVLVGSVFVVAGSLLTDIISAALDPRVRRA